MIIYKTIKKKGGIVIKKIKFFLILIISLFIANTLVIDVHAESFYEGEYIDGVYMNKYQYSTKTTFYQKARFFRKSGTNEPAYCIEPFAFFNENIQYESTINPYNLNEYQKERISKIAYYGYGYDYHQSPEWYAITQLMIWQEADSDGNYYFTNGLNGARIDIYQNQINEINSLIDSNSNKPILNDEYTVVENQPFIITDNNNQINKYKSNNKEITIENNQIKINGLPEGKYTFQFTKNNTIHQIPQIYYQAYGTQNLLKFGDIPNETITLKINSVKTKIEIDKIDADNNSYEAQGEAELNGAKYIIMDNNNEIVNEVEIINNTCTIENIPFNTYYIQEKEPGKGYTLDEEIYKVEITKENPKLKLFLKNKVIESTVTIHKTYDDNLDESNITFSIYDKNNNFINNVTTNEQGIAETTLPYGSYIVKQINTTEGYYKSDDIEVNIKNKDNINIEVYDEKIEIEVPNTRTNIYKTIIIKILNILLIIC